MQEGAVICCREEEEEEGMGGGGGGLKGLFGGLGRSQGGGEEGGVEFRGEKVSRYGFLFSDSLVIVSESRGLFGKKYRFVGCFCCCGWWLLLLLVIHIVRVINIVFAYPLPFPLSPFPFPFSPPPFLPLPLQI